MGDRIGYVFAFLGGLLVGGFFMYRFAYDQAQEDADREIEEMRKYYQHKNDEKHRKDREEAAEKSQKSRNKPAVSDLAAKKTDSKVNYTMYSTNAPASVETVIEPVILDNRDDFGEDETYSQINLVYYSDNILAEEMSHKVLGKGDVERSIGSNALFRFGEKDEDGDPIEQIWVRNDRTHTYYSVVKDDREFVDAVGWEDDGEDD